MSNAFSNKTLQMPGTLGRVSRDPDGLVDNRPGVSHPNMTRENTAKSTENTRNSKDLFSRDPQHGRDLVNNTHKSSSKQQDGKWVVGIGMRNPSGPKPKSVRKKRKRPGRYASSDELWSGAFEMIDTIGQDEDPKDS